MSSSLLKHPEDKMNLKEISNYRIINQRIAKTEFNSAKEIVGWMGAMQAQDYSMAKWAIGLRLMNSTEDAIENSLNKGEIIRTHIMRPTWHFVSAEDIYWMLELTSPQIKPLLKSRHKALELTDAVHSKSCGIIEKALVTGNSLTRAELSKEFEKAKIITNENRLSHLLLYAELSGLICSGPIKDKKLTYALLSERIPKNKLLTRAESLAALAKRYFTSHGPATIPDFAWWSGLSMRDSKQALEFVKSDFISETIDLKEYWFSDSLTETKNRKTNIHLLPAYDEFLISYKDKNASLNLSDNKNVISDNGIFRPVIVINGQVAGLWKCLRKNNSVDIEINFLHKQNNSTKKLTGELAEIFGNFLGKETNVIINNGNKY
jgi:hypothetical protein